MSTSFTLSPDDTARVLTAWLGGRLASAEVTVSNFDIPRAGFSNQTAFFDVMWIARGRTRRRSVVLRVQPTTHQVFARPDALFQAEVMRALERATPVPVPHVWLIEADPEVLGAPFYVMDRVPGRVPSDEPSWHRRGWVAELRVEQREELYVNALAELVRLHTVDWREAVAFLNPPGDPDPLDAYLARLREWYTWTAADLLHGNEELAAAFSYLDGSRPQRPGLGVVWGDARPGNMIFADDLSVAALVDWEGTTLGPPEIDLGWWLLFEENLAEAQGLVRLEGVPDRAQTIAEYELLAGRDVADLGYYEVIAGVGLVLVTSRLRRLLVERGIAPDVAEKYVIRSVAMLRERLERGAR